MRLWWCTLTLVALVVSVLGQNRRRIQGSQGNNRNRVQQGTNTRLGLVSDQLGVPPVPGGHIPGFQVGGRNPNQGGCYCIPINQACPNQPLPDRPVVGDVRIVNRPGQGTCNQEQRFCCDGGGIGLPPTNPFPGTGPVVGPRPPPVVPVPVQIGGGGGGRCGAQNILGRARKFPDADFGEYPWITVILDYNDGFKGTGALIDGGWVLTAAHKVHQERQLKVRLGDYDLKNPQENPRFPHVEIAVSQIIIHPQFNSRGLLNNVALLRLAQPINTHQYPHIGTACLPRQGQTFFGQTCWVTGWGKDDFSLAGSFQAILKEVDVPVVDPFVCQSRLRGDRLGHDYVLDSNSFVCAGGVVGKDACTGDGGAPLVCGGTVVGLVAWGLGCARSEVPGVYVNVASYVNFIQQYVGRGF